MTTNAYYASVLRRENPDLYNWIRAAAIMGKLDGSYAVEQKVLKDTGDKRLAALAACTASYEMRSARYGR